MKVCHFNTFPYGGAAYAARRIHDSLRLEGVLSKFYYWKNNRKQLDATYERMEFEQPEEIPLLGPIIRKHRRIKQRQIKNRYDKHIRPRNKDLEVFSGAQLLDHTRINWNIHGADVIHLHWVAFFLDYMTFFASIPDEVPVVWTLHDMNPLSGGCHYSGACSRFTVGCGQCPQLIQPHATDESFESFKIKKRAIKKKNLTVVAPSRWMLNLAKSSMMFNANTRFEYIRYGFDLDVFRPYDKQQIRKELGIDCQGKFIVGFGAEDINHHRKGFHYVVETLRRLKQNPRIECVVFGGGDLPEDLQQLSKIHSFGFIEEPEQQAKIYSAMDCFLLPSLEDNSPQTGLEAMACGTPVVAFDTGGISEYVLSHQSGLLCSTGNANKLAASVDWLSKNPLICKRMAARSRRLMEARYSLREQAYNYRQLYDSIREDVQQTDSSKFDGESSSNQAA